MTRTEVKDRINQIIDRLPDRTLEAVYELFKRADMDQKIDLSSDLEKVLKEDKNLLQRLAK